MMKSIVEEKLVSFKTLEKKFLHPELFFKILLWSADAGFTFGQIGFTVAYL